MAFTPFNKSNWTRTCSSEHARVYSPSSVGGVPSQNITGNGGAATITLTVPFQFQGNGQVEVSLPAGANGINTALDFSTSYLLAPASGSYSAGNHPRVQFVVQNSSNTNVTPLSNDVVVVQY